MNEENQKIKDFYTISEFALYLRVHANTVRRAIKSGRIVAFKFGTDKKSTYRIPHSEIERIVIFDMKKIFINIIKHENL